MTNGVTDNIDWIQGRGCPGSIQGWVLKKSIHLIYVLYIIYVIYIVYILYKYYIYIYIYILHIYVESKVSGI